MGAATDEGAAASEAGAGEKQRQDGAREHGRCEWATWEIEQEPVQMFLCAEAQVAAALRGCQSEQEQGRGQPSTSQAATRWLEQRSRKWVQRAVPTPVQAQGCSVRRRKGELERRRQQPRRGQGCGAQIAPDEQR